jgi:hypothetical protein
VEISPLNIWWLPEVVLVVQVLEVLLRVAAAARVVIAAVLSVKHLVVEPPQRPRLFIRLHKQ